RRRRSGVQFRARHPGAGASGGRVLSDREPGHRLPLADRVPAGRAAVNEHETLSPRAGTALGRPGPINPILTGPGEYPFVTLDRMRRALAPSDRKVIHFGMGDPREETPEFIRATLRDAITPVSSYPLAAGQPELRPAAAGGFERRFGVALDPERHLLPANGTKEAVFLMALAVVGERGGSARRTVVIPTPAYPVYEPGARFAGADVHVVPL